MIFRHFADTKTGSHSYLIASNASREAAIINPVENSIEAYLETLEELGLRLEYTLETNLVSRGSGAARTLCDRVGALRIGPVEAIVAAPEAANARVVDIEAKTGRGVKLGQLDVECVMPPGAAAGEIAYRVDFYTFVDYSILIDYHESTLIPDGEPEAILDPVRPPSAPNAPAPRSTPIDNRRTTRTGECVERLILEDLHTSVIEKRFTPKEERVVMTYIRYLEEHEFASPSASELSRILGNVDRTAVHVLVHNIRWKQIDLERLPMLLTGQTSKWLRGLQTRPEFTSHEREFLSTYLELVRRNAGPPSGPEIAEALGGERSVQWVRKRAHTVRRKQRDFHQPILILARKRSESTQPQHLESGERHGTEMPVGF
jgi:hypothetical protein